MLHQYVLNLTAAETTPPSTTSYWLSDKPIGALRPPRAGPLIVTWLSFNATIFSREKTGAYFNLLSRCPPVHLFFRKSPQIVKMSYGGAFTLTEGRRTRCCSPPVKEVAVRPTTAGTSRDRSHSNDCRPSRRSGSKKKEWEQEEGVGARRRSGRRRSGRSTRTQKRINERGMEYPPKIFQVCVNIQPNGRRLTHTYQRAPLIKAKPFVKYATLTLVYDTLLTGMLMLAHLRRWR